MKFTVFRVHGTRAEHLEFYGGLLLTLGLWDMLLNFIHALPGSFMCSFGDGSVGPP